ncbi:MAG: hypothetical protein HQL32_17070 [Planctomycetes bacterium]|nr:hypothetical protein [Planctomycetota bacterium]
MNIIRNYILKQLLFILCRFMAIGLLLITFFTLLKLWFKGQSFSSTFLLLSTFYSLSEALPYLVALAGYALIRQLNQRGEIHLMELYRPIPITHFNWTWPLLIPTSLYLILFIGFLKPQIKYNVDSLKSLLTSEQNRDQLIDLNKGVVWTEENKAGILSSPQWLQKDDEDATFTSLDAQSANVLDHFLVFNQGKLTQQKDKESIRIQFQQAKMLTIRKNKKIKEKSIIDLYRDGLYYPLFFRLNNILLPWLLTALAFACTKIGGSKGLLSFCACLIFIYTPAFAALRKAHHLHPALAILPICLLLLTVVLLRVKLKRSLR